MGAFKSTVLVCNLLGVRNTTDRVTEEEIRLMIQESARDGDVQEVERIFNLGDRDLESIMTPRGLFIPDACDYLSADSLALIGHPGFW